VQRVLGHERVVALRSVVIAQLRQVVLAEVAVDAILVAALALAREVLLHGFRTAEVREAEADDVERVGDAPLVAFIVLRVEVVADRDLVVEQRDVPMQRLVVHFLLVERPAELVERELVVLGDRAHLDDRLVRALGIAILLAREEVLGAAEMDFVEILRTRIGGDELLHHLHRLDRAPELVVRTRLLVQHLVVVLGRRVLLQQAVVELDRFERTRPCEIVRGARRELSLQHVLRRRDPLLLIGTLFELLLGADCQDADAGRGLRRRSGGARGRQFGSLRGRQLEQLARAVQPIFLLDLQVGQAPHRLRRALRLRRFFEEALVAVHCRVEAAFDLHVLQIRRDLAQRAQCVLRRRAGARSEERRAGDEHCAVGTHHCPPPAGAALPCVFAARS
jgi:hypothetical protein